MQRYMLFAFVLFGVVVGLLAYGGQHGGALEALPNHVDGHAGGVRHLLVIETVVAQLVKDNLVSYGVWATP